MKITVKRGWTASRVRSVCIENSLYSRGDNEEYARMLEQVTVLEPTYDNIYLIAKDIMEHSSTECDIASIMYVLEREAVFTLFDVKE